MSNPVWADRNVIETVLPFNAIILDSCTAEQVHFTGQETYSPSSTINNNTLHLTIHDTGQIDGVGQSTGAAYRISFDTNIEQNSEIPPGPILPVEYDLVLKANIIAQGALDNSYYVERAHVTINADGATTVSRGSVSPILSRVRTHMDL